MPLSLGDAGQNTPSRYSGTTQVVMALSRAAGAAASPFAAHAARRDRAGSNDMIPGSPGFAACRCRKPHLAEARPVRVALHLEHARFDQRDDSPRMEVDRTGARDVELARDQRIDDDTRDLSQRRWLQRWRAASMARRPSGPSCSARARSSSSGSEDSSSSSSSGMSPERSKRLTSVSARRRPACPRARASCSGSRRCRGRPRAPRPSRGARRWRLGRRLSGLSW